MNARYQKACVLWTEGLLLFFMNYMPESLKHSGCFVSFIEAYGEFKVFQIFTIIIGARFHGLHVK